MFFAGPTFVVGPTFVQPEIGIVTTIRVWSLWSKMYILFDGKFRFFFIFSDFGFFIGEDKDKNRRKL